MQANGRKQGLGVLFGHVNCEMPIRQPSEVTQVEAL